MGVFRLQNNTPGVYQEQSRDFQLLSRIMDTIHGGVMGDITPMQNLSRPRVVYDSMLNAYSSKVGFFPRRSIDAKVLRYILAAFPYIIKNKGTAEGIRQATTAVIKAENRTYRESDITIEVDNGSHTILVRTTYEIYNQNALEEVFRYVMPAGYEYRFILTLPVPPVLTTTDGIDTITATGANVEVSGVRSVMSVGNIISDGHYTNAFIDSKDYGPTGDVDALRESASGTYPTESVSSVSSIDSTLNNNTEENNED